VITIVGIGADGWAGLTGPAQQALLEAREVFGSARQLASIPIDRSRTREWPSPMAPAIDELASRAGEDICVVGSGDPMLHGIGSTLAARVPTEQLTVIPHVSAYALACARLGWPQAEVELISAVGRPVDVVARALQPGRRLVVYVTGRDGADQLARALQERGFGGSRFAVLQRLGAADEAVWIGPARDYIGRSSDPLHAVAVGVRSDPDTPLLSRVPGLPDDAYLHDGALTKWPVRAVTLAALAPTPGALLWDIGAGSGSIAIEWMRAEPTARAIAVEKRPDRVERLTRNATVLGVPALQTVAGDAPGVLDGLETPDAIFIGGGLSADGMLEACWQSLKPGGRIAANAVTLEGEAALSAARQRYGGELTRLDVSYAGALGSFNAWRPALPVVLWSATRR
jgi:precorrin-6Y C5,15-methyltransferase (decarboxylating)